MVVFEIQDRVPLHSARHSEALSERILKRYPILGVHHRHLLDRRLVLEVIELQLVFALLHLLVPGAEQVLGIVEYLLQRMMKSQVDYLVGGCLLILCGKH